MKPIGQTFYLDAPISGPSGYYITKIGVFFRSISTLADDHHIVCELRLTDNGVITPQLVTPYAKKELRPSDTTDGLPKSGTNSYILKSSENATAETVFEFDTPIYVATNQSYGIVFYPLDGSDSYQIWTAVVGDVDVTTGKQIFTNNDIGDLFISSNDKVWQPVINEDMKFNLYIANFTASSGTAYFHNPNEDFLEIYNQSGTFTAGEPVYASNGSYNIATLKVNTINGSFNSGDYVFQNTSGSNTAQGTVYGSNSTVIRVNVSNGAFANTANVYNANSTSNAYVTAVNTSFISSTSNTLIVPDTSIFAVNDAIYVSKNDGTKTAIVGVTAITLSSNTISVNNAITFSDSACVVGKLKGNGKLVGGYSSVINHPDYTRLILDYVTSNATMSFTQASGEKLIGYYSGQTARIKRSYDATYNTIVPQFAEYTPPNTSIDFAFKGFKNNPNDPTSPFLEDSYIPVKNHGTNELRDFERIAMSRSSEYSKLPVYRQGNNSVVISATLASGNNYVSPHIDAIQKEVTYTYNVIASQNQLTGYNLSIANTVGTFSAGDTIAQGGVSGVISYVTQYYIVVNNVTGGSFLSNTAISDTTSGATALATSAQWFDESIDNNFFRSSRYISKDVVLADGQDSEDILFIMGAYRPAGTDFNTFVKIKNKDDPEDFSKKTWSQLVETTPASLLSSTVNTNDYVELKYTFPLSYNITPNNVSVSSSSNTITYNTYNLVSGEYVYIGDNTTANGFCIRMVTGANSTVIQLNTAPPFTSSNCTFGYIPELQSPTAAFLYDRNNNVARYVTANGGVYDSYIRYRSKIVPVSNSSAIVPMVDDLRIINLQV